VEQLYSPPSAFRRKAGRVTLPHPEGLGLSEDSQVMERNESNYVIACLGINEDRDLGHYIGKAKVHPQDKPLLAHSTRTKMRRAAYSAKRRRPHSGLAYSKVYLIFYVHGGRSKSPVWHGIRHCYLAPHVLHSINELGGQAIRHEKPLMSIQGRTSVLLTKERTWL
jgi:hypothetical protein